MEGYVAIHAFMVISILCSRSFTVERSCSDGSRIARICMCMHGASQLLGSDNYNDDLAVLMILEKGVASYVQLYRQLTKSDSYICIQHIASYLRGRYNDMLYLVAKIRAASKAYMFCCIYTCSGKSYSNQQYFYKAGIYIIAVSWRMHAWVSYIAKVARIRKF